MKIEKKHIVIVLIVAVVVYLWWRNNNKSSGSTGDGSKPTNVKTDVDAILKKIGATEAEKAFVKDTVASINASQIWKESIIEKAKNDGITYEQEAVINALWVMYKTEGTGMTAERDYYLYKEVLAL